MIGTNNQNSIVPDQLAWGRPDAAGAGHHYGLVGQNNLGVYTEPGLASFGGSLKLPFNGPQVGGTVGMQNGQPFGSYNINHKIQGQFGPQDTATLPLNAQLPNPLINFLQRLVQVNNQARNAVPNWANKTFPSLPKPSQKKILGMTQEQIQNMAVAGSTAAGDMNWSSSLAPSSFSQMKPDTRGFAQAQIEDAINSGDMTRARQLSEALPKGMYREAMLDFFSKMPQEAQGTFTQIRPGVYQPVINGVKNVMGALNKIGLTRMIRPSDVFK